MEVVFKKRSVITLHREFIDDGQSVIKDSLQERTNLSNKLITDEYTLAVKDLN